MSIFWCEQSAINVPDTNSWLSEKERSYLAGLRFAKRRDDWRLGRWTAKCSVATCLGLPRDVPSLSAIEIWPDRFGAPLVFLAQDRANVTISLSHCSGKAVCAVAPPTARIGCDLELVEARDASFVSDYFDADEQAMIEQTSEEKRSLIITLLWSAKESALKAFHLGLRLDTRCLGVSLSHVLSPQEERLWLDTYPIALLNSLSPDRTSSADTWHPFQVRLRNQPAFIGWWRNPDHFIRTLLIRNSVPNLGETAGTQDARSRSRAQTAQ